MADTDVTRIAGNIGAMNALYALNNINKQLSIHQTRLATGKRINSAADDPAGLAISTKMLSRSLSLKTALSNIGDAKNLLAVAESGLGRLTDILNSMRTITEQAASDTLGTEERNIVKEQLASYASQINDIVDQTKWSDKKLIDGSYESASLTFQTGADVNETTLLSGLKDMKAASLSLLRNASTAVDASVSATNIGTSVSVALSTVTGTELSSGSYTVETDFQSNGSYTLSLMRGATIAAQTTGTYTAGESKDIVFGNGLTVTMADSGIYAATVAAAVSTYAVTAGSISAIGAAAVAGGGADAVSGTYSVSIALATNGAYTATLTPGAGGTAISTTGTYSSAAALGIDFGNGIMATMAAGISTASPSTLTGNLTYVSYEAASYSLADSSEFTYQKTLAENSVNIGELEDAAAFSAYMSIIDSAMVVVNSQLSKIGSLTGSLTFKEDQVSSSQINVEASYNRIMNANMAEEQVNASKLLILQQTSTAMLAQANAAPQFLLSLFQ